VRYSDGYIGGLGAVKPICVAHRWVEKQSVGSAVAAASRHRRYPRMAVREGDVTAVRYADGAAIKDSFGILRRVTFHQQIIARLWRFL